MKLIQTCIIFLLSFWGLFAVAQRKDSTEIMLKNNNITFDDLKNIQAEKLDLINEIGVSTRYIWSHSEAPFYSLGAQEHADGKDVNYGISLNYSRCIYKDFFGVIGLGFFNQQFSIERPFYYETSDGTKPLVSTKYYTYRNIHWMVGLGYKKIITKGLAIKTVASYNNFNSYRQRYAQEYDPGINEVYKKSFPIGYMINLDGIIEKNISKRISANLGIVLPVYIHWNKDKMFINNSYSPREQRIARNIFSIGGSFSCNYRF
ncbi:MAG: hypothetical protein J5I50_08035 [Chitinophagaceae bacterium]|nr:hypothetical protein [Chitinophagaceae bacterium]